MELLKYPRALVCTAQKGGDEYISDRKIENVYLRDGGTVVLIIGNFENNGELKYYK